MKIAQGRGTSSARSKKCFLDKTIKKMVLSSQVLMFKKASHRYILISVSPQSSHTWASVQQPEEILSCSLTTEHDSENLDSATEMFIRKDP